MAGGQNQFEKQSNQIYQETEMISTESTFKINCEQWRQIPASSLKFENIVQLPEICPKLSMIL